MTGPVVEIRRAVNNGLFTAYDDEPIWGVAHRIMAPLLSPSNVEATFTEMRDTAAALTTKWTRSSAGQRLDVTSDLKRLNLQAVTLCLFDKQVDCFSDPEPAVIKAMDNATAEAVKRPTRARLVNSLMYQRGFDNNIRTMRDYAASIVADRNSHPTPKKDMLHAIMHAQDPETGKGLNEKQVIDEVLTLIMGSSTAPCLVSFALYYLLKNPQEIVKAREEIDAVIGPEGQFIDSHLSALKYCEAILRETLRLSATAPGFNIEPLPSPDTPETVALADGKYQIPKKQAMIIVLSAVNRDPSVFTDPESFRPERMLGEAYDKLPTGVKKGFGNGKRQCVGTLYAWQSVVVTLVSILKDVDLELADKTYELSMKGNFQMEPVNFFAVPGPRAGSVADRRKS